MADQKTEKPTQRRLTKAREDGDFATAKLFVSSMQFLAFVSLLHAFGPAWIRGAQTGLISILQTAMNPRLGARDLVFVCVGLMKQLMIPVGLLGAVMIGITIAVQLIVTGFGLSMKKLTPDIKRLNPLTKLKQMPGQNASSLLQAAIMLPVFSAAVYFIVKANLMTYLALPLSNLTNGVGIIGTSLEALLWKAAGLFVAFGAVDLVRQKARYQKQLKMSKQEIRDESKEMEGNPLAKQRIRRIRRDLARRRMMKEVPTATAVIVNPTHYAIALKYSLEEKGAPKVVAKGKNYLALRIKQKAIDSGVAIIENPPLAQSLYKSVDVGHEIPAQFYRAVAEVLAYVYRVMNGRTA